MSEHILGPRARFWLAVVDWTERLHCPAFVQWWALGRAAEAVRDQAERRSA